MNDQFIPLNDHFNIICQASLLDQSLGDTDAA
jgi:hypothetical protein